MKILTISGERPNLIKMIPVINKLYTYFEHKLVWIGQNFEECLAGQFFKEFNIKPDISIDNIYKKRGMEYFALVLPKLEKIYQKEKPDCVLVLGDSNASLAGVYVAKRCGITVFHMEAGNRCYDMKRVPEETNRVMIDSICDWYLCYTQRAREQLLLEDKHPSKIVVIGNPIVETIKLTGIEGTKKKNKNYYLATIHRKENIENPIRLKRIMAELGKLKHEVRLSLHPSLESKLIEISKAINTENIKMFAPSNFSDFLKLERDAICVITDSGTVPEECHLLNVPCVLLRLSTERPELLESNSFVVCGDPNDLNKAVEIAVNETDNLPIPEYHYKVSSNVIKVLMRWKNETQIN